MTARVQLRRAVSGDATTVGRLQQEMDRELGVGDEPGFLDRFARAWLAGLEHRPTWLAERDGRAVGVLVLVVVDKLPRAGWPAGCWAHVSLVFVTAAARNAGIGRRLLQEMLVWAETNRVDRIQLNANPASARLYRRVGLDAAPARLMERRL